MKSGDEIAKKRGKRTQTRGKGHKKGKAGNN